MHDAHAGAALAAVLGVLDAAVVEREAEAVPVLGVELGEVAAAGERPLEHALGELGVDERHAALRPSFTTSTICTRRRQRLLLPARLGLQQARVAVWS